MTTENKTSPVSTEKLSVFNKSILSIFDVISATLSAQLGFCQAKEPLKRDKAAEALLFGKTELTKPEEITARDVAEAKRIMTLRSEVDGSKTRFLSVIHVDAELPFKILHTYLLKFANEIITFGSTDESSVKDSFILDGSLLKFITSRIYSSDSDEFKLLSAKKEDIVHTEETLNTLFGSLTKIYTCLKHDTTGEKGHFGGKTSLVAMRKSVLNALIVVARHQSGK